MTEREICDRYAAALADYFPGIGFTPTLADGRSALQLRGIDECDYDMWLASRVLAALFNAGVPRLPVVAGSKTWHP